MKKNPDQKNPQNLTVFIRKESTAKHSKRTRDIKLLKIIGR